MPLSHLVTTPGRQPVTITMPSFIVGQDASGRWIAVETHGLGGGLFRSLVDAMHYALAETRRRPDAILIASGPVELQL